MAHGGHLTHGAAVSFSGKIYHAEQYGITDDGVIDYDVLREQALRVKPKVIVGWLILKLLIGKCEIADAVGAYLSLIWHTLPV